MQKWHLSGSTTTTEVQMGGSEQCNSRYNNSLLPSFPDCGLEVADGCTTLNILSHETVYLKWVKCMGFELHANKTLLRRKMKKGIQTLLWPL